MNVSLQQNHLPELRNVAGGGEGKHASLGHECWIVSLKKLIPMAQTKNLASKMNERAESGRISYHLLTYLLTYLLFNHRHSQLVSSVCQ